MRKAWNLFFILLFVGVFSCTPKTIIKEVEVVVVPEVVEPKGPKNIIFLIGDGMGLSQISAGLYSNGNKISFERFNHIGLHKCYASDKLITDSAAAAAAFACGVKTYNGAIGVDADTVPVKTILEEAEELGFMTGLVSSSSVVHATPASYIAHNKYRKNYEEIAEDFLKTDVDFVIGGGKKYFDRREKDDRNLYAELEGKGYVVSDYFKEGLNRGKAMAADRFVHFTADAEPLSVDAGRDYLIPASELALEFFGKKSEDGFFLMIEGSQIDWGGHANDQNFVISELLEYDKIIHRVLDFAEKDGETLVVVTADHETGGMAIQPASRMDSLEIAFTSTYHTGTMIPVFAFGPGAENFNGIYENTEIYYKMKELLFE